ncbi:hypothetical protein PHJA_002840200, partial [Phtheirospermum japonicum]
GSWRLYVTFLGLIHRSVQGLVKIIPGLLKRVNRLEGDLGRRNFREKLLWMLLIVSWIVMYLFK